MPLHDSPENERLRFWNEHNQNRDTLNDHGHRIKTVESRVDRLESHMSEQYGAVLTKLDGVSGEVRTLNERYIESTTAMREREKIAKENMGTKWPLVVSIIVALVAVGSLVANVVTMVR